MVGGVSLASHLIQNHNKGQEEANTQHSKRHNLQRSIDFNFYSVKIQFSIPGERLACHWICSRSRHWSSCCHCRPGSEASVLPEQIHIHIVLDVIMIIIIIITISLWWSPCWWLSETCGSRPWSPPCSPLPGCVHWPTQSLCSRGKP